MSVNGNYKLMDSLKRIKVFWFTENRYAIRWLRCLLFQWTDVMTSLQTVFGTRWKAENVGLYAGWSKTLKDSRVFVVYEGQYMLSGRSCLQVMPCGQAGL